MKTVIILMGGCLFFGDEMPLKKLAGISVAMCGIVWYSQVRESQGYLALHHTFSIIPGCLLVYESARLGQKLDSRPFCRPDKVYTACSLVVPPPDTSRPAADLSPPSHPSMLRCTHCTLPEGQKRLFLDA